MRSFLPLMGLLLAGCYWHPLYDTVPLAESASEPCRGYAGGLEYCGDRAFGIPDGQGTMKFPDGSEVTGTWKGETATAAVKQAGALRVYGSFSRNQPVGSHEIRNQTTGETRFVLLKGDTHSEIEYRRDGKRTRFSEGAKDAAERKVMEWPSPGQERYFNTVNGNIHGELLTAGADGVTHWQVFENGVDVTKQVVPARLLDAARLIAVADAESGIREAEAKVQEAEREEAAAATAVVDADRLKQAVPQVQGLCTCIATKLSAKQSEAEAINQCRPPVPIAGACPAEQDPKACEDDRKAQQASAVRGYDHQIDLCRRFKDDPAKSARKWKKAEAEYLAALNDLQTHAEAEKTAASAKAQSERTALKAHQNRLAAVKVAKDADLKPEIAQAQQRVLAEYGQQVEALRAHWENKCKAAANNVCGCQSQLPPPPPEGGPHACQM